jgi:hypothetical protein
MPVMSTWRIGNATLSFALPGTELLEHAGIGDSGHVEIEQGETRSWWWFSDDCDGSPCTCGRLTLLEALERLQPGLRAEAVRAHADEMRRAYDHFWAGQAVASGVTTALGAVCVDCLVNGARHVWTIYEEASTLAEEFGEALSAYAYELLVGEPRYHRNDDPTRNRTN